MAEEKQYYIYLLTNYHNTVIYTGVTNDIIRRVYQHKAKQVDGFSKKYSLTKLGYYEVFDNPQAAISREKQIKAGSRQKKLTLINNFNPEWDDLYDQLS